MSLTKVTYSMINGAVYNVLDFGADPTGVAFSTAAIQNAIDKAYANGGGTVYLPEGTYKLNASASAETWQTKDALGNTVTIGPGACALIMRNKVYLSGDNKNVTTLTFDANTNLDGIYIDHSPNGYGILDLTLDGGWDGVGEWNSHGIFWVTKTIADEVNTLFYDGQIRNVNVFNVGGYGFGVQHGVIRGNVFDNIRTLNTGNDGVDCKSHYENKGNRITNATVSGFGLKASAQGQSGIGVRGEGWAIIAPRVTDFGRADTIHTGIRFDAGGTINGNPAEKSYVTDFVISTTVANTRGVESFGENCSIGPGDITGCASPAVWLRNIDIYSAKNNTVVGVTVDGLGASGNGFASENSTVVNPKFIGCTAKNIQQGFRPGGLNDNIIGCSIDGTVTTPLSKSGNPTGLVVTSSPSLAFQQSAPAFLSNDSFSIADDAVVYIPTGTISVYQAALITASSVNPGQPNGIFIFRTSSSPQINNLIMNTVTNITFVIGVLTGTTGADGDFTVGAAEGGLYFENRTGAERVITLTFFGQR